MSTDTTTAPEADTGNELDSDEVAAQDRENVKSTVASIIARSRYEAWDANAKTIPWDEFMGVDPQTAVGIYIEDGLRDAEALMPLLESLIEVSTMVGASLAADAVAEVGQ